jgi:hypothetical protein
VSSIKVTNLQAPSAASPAIVLASDGSATAQLSSLNGGALSGARNRIINGDMRIDQRNAGASVTATATAYGLDRWKMAATASSKYSYQQNAGSVTPPTGFSNYLGVTSLSAYTVGSGDNFVVYQLIEGYNVSDLGWGTANAKTITVSFWVRSSLIGTFGGAIGNVNATRSYPFTYSISVQNTWEYKTITIAGDTSGTWNTTNGAGLVIYLAFGTGSTISGTAGAWAGAEYYSATGATSVVGTNGATFYITGVQLEAGSVATPFERRSYGQELALAQRYYYRISSSAASGNYCKYGQAFASATTNYNAQIFFPVPMRSSPTLDASTTSGSAGSGFCVWDSTSDLGVTSLTVDQASRETISLFCTVSGAVQYRTGVLQSFNNKTSYIGFSAEL